MIKSPFKIFRNLLSPLLCEQIVDCLEFKVPDTIDKHGQIPAPQTIQDPTCQQAIINRVLAANVVDQVEQHFTGFTFRGSTKFEFTRLEQGCTGIDPHGDNCELISGKWAQTKPYDLSCYIALNDNNDKHPFDSDYEVYGGKYQFINHSFGFLPERGTLIVHPSSPHFINAHGPIKLGSLTFVKFYLVSTLPMIYQPSDYPGNFVSWFEGV